MSKDFTISTKELEELEVLNEKTDVVVSLLEAIRSLNQEMHIQTKELMQINKNLKKILS